MTGNDRHARQSAQSPPGRKTKLLVEVGEGRAAGALLENGFLEHCVDLGASVHVLSPGARFQPFVDRYARPGVRFSYLSVTTPGRFKYPRLTWREEQLGRWLAARGLRRTRRRLWRFFGERLARADAGSWAAAVSEDPPDCFVSTNLNLGYGRGIMAVCRQLGIPTLGNVFSWDHPYNRQLSRPDRLTCWSPMMKEDLVRFGGFKADAIEITGAPLFDPYFDHGGAWTRKELCDHFGLDASRPVLLYATLGQMERYIDETGTFRAFLEALDNASLPGPPQIILRLHPLSVDYYFKDFRSRKDVVFSRYTGYCPGMRWWPSREEALLAGNTLRHADVCISPGSTMTVEAAIFDTPTIIPAFNPMIPDEYVRFFRKDWLNRHFHFLAQEDRVPVAETPEDLIEGIRAALADRTWQSKGRRAIRDYVLGPLDGRATERFARSVLRCAAGKAAPLEMPDDTFAGGESRPAEGTARLQSGGS